MFTERDRAIFHKLSLLEAKQSDYSIKIKEIEDGKKKIFLTFGKVNQRIAEMSEELFSKFKDNF